VYNTFTFRSTSLRPSPSCPLAIPPRPRLSSNVLLKPTTSLYRLQQLMVELLICWCLPHLSCSCKFLAKLMQDVRPSKLGTANPCADYPSGTESHIAVLHKAILVLSQCDLECPKEVSEMILHISGFMDPPKPDAFAPTIVGVETVAAAVDMEKKSWRI
jgi:hypothetical protein